MLMSSPTFTSIQDALKTFRDAAVTKGDFATPVELDHELHARMQSSASFLFSEGDKGLEAFASMLHDVSPHVRGWVAAQLLSQGYEAAKAVLEKLCNEQGIIGFNSRVTLDEYRAGRLHSPFQVSC